MNFGVMISPVPRDGTMQQMQEANEAILQAANRNGWGLWFVDHLQAGEMPYLECWTANLDSGRVTIAHCLLPIAQVHP